ncbi:MAG: glycosyl hydrolase family 95 catalytic domain-containing protein [Chthoniobacterales bacterium]
MNHSRSTAPLPPERLEAPAEPSRLLLRTPARDWRAALPLGNGSLAALVHGRTAAEVVTLNHESLWGGATNPTMPDVSATLARVRQALAAGRYEEAEHLLGDELERAGYGDAFSGAYMPGPDLLIRAHGKSGYRDYRRALDLVAGEAEVRWTAAGRALSRRSFVSETENAFVCQCGVPPGAAVRHDISLAPHDLRDTFLNGLVRTAISPHVVHHAFAEGAGITVDLGNGCRYIAAFRVRGAGNFVHEANAVSCDFGPDTVLFCALEPVDGPSQGDVSVLYAALERRDEGYETMLARHIVRHAVVAGPAEFQLDLPEGARARSNEELLLDAYGGDLPGALAERLFHYGRYLLACSSRPGGLPAHLQGKWNGEYAPPWNCAYFNNENLQMSYWQALPGNMGAALLPVFDLYESLLEDFRENARKLFGCRGILLPLYNSPFNGRQTNLQPHVLYWTGAGAWLSQLYWEYWLFTGDREFLAGRALPFMREVALFYRDFLQIGTDGQLLMSPGNSPENRARPHGTSVCINATMDFALLRELLGNLLAGGRELGREDPLAGEWKRLLGLLPAYQVDGTGALREWMHPDFGENHEHRHISHIYPFFPGHEIPPDPSHPLHLAVRNSVRQRMAIGLAEQTGWSFTHLANIFGRLGDGDTAHECLGHLAQSCLSTSLFTYHNDTRGMGVTMDLLWGLAAPLQLDAILGFPAAVMEMLLYSSPGEIRLLPALPRAWAPGGSFAGWHTRCGVEVACRWKDGAIEADLRALRPASFRLKVPQPGGGWHEEDLRLADGERRTLGWPARPVAA